jgi:hypothetical protein
MLLFVTFVLSMVMWIVLWATGAKALDAMMLVILIMVSAAIVHIVLPMLPGNRRRDD